MGDCYASQGQYAEVLPWFERAVARAEKGDVHGCIDSASLGTSLHQVGYCYARQGQYTEALPWVERAVAAKQKGDVHGRVNSESLGTSLNLAGDCYTKLGKVEEARSWFERALRFGTRDRDRSVSARTIILSGHSGQLCLGSVTRSRRGSKASAARRISRRR